MPPQDVAFPEQHPSAGELARFLLVQLAATDDPSAVLAAAFPRLLAMFRCTGGGIIHQAGRGWTIRHWEGSHWKGHGGPLPERLIGEVFDHGAGREEENWIAAPVDLGAGETHLLLLGGWDDANRPAVDRPSLGEIEACGHVLGMALRIARRGQHHASRCERLAEMSRIAAQWSQNDHSAALLEAIAAAATRLLGAERASIFLWDRRRHKLVGRPALGVEGGQLEVDDAEGVVGAVLHSGQPRRWQTGDDGEAEVNRSVDRRLRFETRSLAAVPLWDPKSNASEPARRAPIGVFELINHRTGSFTDDDIEALEEFATQAAAAIHNTQAREQLAESRDRLTDSAAEGARVIGDHPAMVALRETARRVAETDLAVLVLGENGTGKEVLARSIHFQGPRKHQPFVAVNCAALVETLLESELFGHEKGAFTDAHQARQGKFELATGGTLFLDEVGDLSPGGQAKLLRVLEEKIVIRVGGSTPIPIDVRVIAATNQPLSEMVRAKKFREDLFFRLNVVTLQLPPLRERGDDIIMLTEHFLQQFAHQVGRRVPRLAASARQRLLQHSWPGNIRELRNLVERVSYLCPGDTIEASDLALSTTLLHEPPAGQQISTGPMAGRTLADATRDFQVAHIGAAIEQCGGNMTDAAGRLGLHRSNLYRKMRQLGIDTSDK